MDTRKAGKIGGKRRAERMTPEERSAAAQQASRAFWDALSPEQRSRVVKERAAKRKRRRR